MAVNLSIIALWLLFAAFYFFNAFDRAENYIYDKTYQRVSPVDSRIVVIGVDDASIARLGQWPWPRGIMAAVVDRLTEGGAAAVGIDVLFDTPGAREAGEDESFALALERAGNVVLAVHGLFKERTTRGNADNLIVPTEVLRATHLGHVNSMTESDGVIRRMLLGFSYDGKNYNSIAYETAKIYSGADFQDEIPRDAGGRYYVKFTGRSGWYHPLSFADVYEGKVAPVYFKGKIVIIGLYAQGIAQDWQYTAIDGDRPTYGVEVHANMVQQFLESNYLRDLSRPVSLGIFVLFSIAAAVLCTRYKPRAGLCSLVALLAAYSALEYIIARAGYVTNVLYTPAFCLAAYVLALIWHYVQTRMNEVRVRTTFGKYMAPPVVKKILDEGEEGLKLGGTRRLVTVLFADIRGFTSLSETMPPEEVVRILNEYLDLVSSCIHRYEGTLDKFIGDATMAIWGAPYDMEGHALAAVRAAMAMREEAVMLSQKLTARYNRDVRFGIGINSGDAIIGNIGASFRMDYTAIGDTVNTAARLESNAKPGQILISKTTADKLLDKDIPMNFLGGLKVKGKAEEIPVYEISEEGENVP